LNRSTWDLFVPSQYLRNRGGGTAQLSRGFRQTKPRGIVAIAVVSDSVTALDTAHDDMV
jgi:hypothetical protein